ncbi:MAG: D-2-hydroxyacid dehydrogenase [Bacillota bacterium]
MKILSTHELTEEQKNKILHICPGAGIHIERDRERMPEHAEGTEILFGGRFDARFLKAAKDLRWIQVTSAGVDRLLFPELVESDITLTNTRGMHARAIAEHVFAMILSFEKHIVKYVLSKEAARWEREQSRMLWNKTMAVLGLGSIGSQVAKIARAFEMRVVGTVRTPRPIEYADRVYGPDEMSHFLPSADYVVICLPLTGETKGYIGRDELALMKPDALLVNIARGNVVEQEALLWALRSGQIRGACLDVFATEPLPSDSPLWQLQNVLITPHVAGVFEGYMEEAMEVFYENLRRYKNNEPLINVVDKKRGY